MALEREQFADAIDKLSEQLRTHHAQPQQQDRSPWQLRISDLIAIISLGGMIYAFVSSQSAAQTTMAMRLDASERMLTEVKRNSDSIPMLQFQMTKMGEKQDSMDKERQNDKVQLQETHEALVKMGMILKERGKL